MSTEAMPMKIFLLGENIEHSYSPRLHNGLFAKHGLPYVYELAPVSTEELPGVIAMMKQGGYRGANVTSPHKERVMELLEECSPEAQRIGAVNCIVFEGGRGTGYNTDAIGFRRTLTHRIFGVPFSAGVMGTGGASSAAVCELLELSNLLGLTVYSRDASRAEEFAARWNDRRITGLPIDAFRSTDVIINATTVGLAHNPDPLLTIDQLAGTRLYYEMVYHPPETRMMRFARAAGAETIPGIGMFMEQAYESFRLWTGCDARERR